MRTTPVVGLAALLATVVAAPVTAAPPAEDPVTAAATLFEAYVRLEHAFDPALADLYADTAVIRNRRIYPTGQERVLEIPAATYKELIRSALPLAEARGDRSTYSDTGYAVEGSNVRITTTRFSELKQYSSPLSLLVGPAPDGRWLILEELSESRP